MLWIRPCHPWPKTPGVEKPLRHVNATAHEIGAVVLAIEHDKIQVLKRTWRRRGDSLSDMNRCFRTGRSELHYAVVFVGGVVDIQPKAQFLVECFGPIDIGNRYDHDF